MSPPTYSPSRVPQAAKLSKADQMSTIPKWSELSEPAPEPTSGMNKEPWMMDARVAHVLKNAAAAVQKSKDFRKQSRERHPLGSTPGDSPRPARQISRASAEKPQSWTPRANSQARQRCASEESRDCHNGIDSNQEYGKKPILHRPPTPGAKMPLGTRHSFPTPRSASQMINGLFNGSPSVRNGGGLDSCSPRAFRTSKLPQPPLAAEHGFSTPSFPVVQNAAEARTSPCFHPHARQDPSPSNRARDLASQNAPSPQLPSRRDRSSGDKFRSARPDVAPQIASPQLSSGRERSSSQRFRSVRPGQSSTPRFVHRGEGILPAPGPGKPAQSSTPRFPLRGVGTPPAPGPSKADHSSTPRFVVQGAETPPAPAWPSARGCRTPRPSAEHFLITSKVSHPNGPSGPGGEMLRMSANPLAQPSRSGSPASADRRPPSVSRYPSDRFESQDASPRLTPRHAQPSGNSPRSSTPRARAGSCTLQWLEEVLRAQPECTPMVVDRLALKSLPTTDAFQNVEHADIKFVETLGKGSFGAVWLGHYQGQEVAVKQCVVGDANDTKMLLEEIRCLQSLRHPRLVSYFGCCNKAPHLLMVMEYMSGGSLHSLLFKKKQRLEFKERARMAYEIAEGLAYVHGLGVVHRDLKSANIVLDDKLSCKLCDFGLTLMLEQSHMTVQRLEGSPRYMAPEQFQPKARITEKCDIWQFGCVMLELFCSAQPFAHCKGLQQIVTELLVRKRTPCAPAEADPRARLFVQASLRMCPAARPSAAALKRALCGTWKERPVAEDRGLEAIPSTGQQRCHLNVREVRL